MLTEAQATDTAEDRSIDRSSAATNCPRPCGIGPVGWLGAGLPGAVDARSGHATAQQQAKIETRQAEEAATGQKKRGRKPKAAKTAADATPRRM